MPHRLEVKPTPSAEALRRGLAPGEAKQRGDWQGGGILEVEDKDEAAELVERYPNVVPAAGDEPDDAPDETPRVTLDNDGVERSDETGVDAAELADEHWRTTVNAVEDGDADAVLDALSEADDRQSVQDAIDGRRRELEGD